MQGERLNDNNQRSDLGRTGSPSADNAAPAFSLALLRHLLAIAYTFKVGG